MAQASIPTSEPAELRAGDNWNWDKSVAEYSATDWTLTYSIIGPSVLHLSSTQITATGSGWEIRVPKATTEPLKPGRYTWYAFVSDGDERYEVGRGQMVVLENVAAIGEGGESFAREQLRIVELALKGRLSADLESYSINGRAVNKIPYAQLVGERNRLTWEIWEEEHPGEPYPGTEVEFVAP